MMKVGLIGCGGMGKTHNLSLKALSGNMDIEVTALADLREEFLEKAAEYWPEARLYKTGMELLEKEDLNSVHICLPSHLHTGHAVAAMDRGIHVFVEKPVCLTKQEGDRLLEAKGKNKVQVMVGQVVRFFDGKFTISPVLVVVPVLICVSWLFSYIMYGCIRRNSIVERLRG